MEEGQNTENQTQVTSQEVSSVTPEVSFPTVGQPKKGNGAKTLLIFGILILVGILGFVIFSSASKNDETLLVEPTPFENLTPDESSTPTPSATATPKPADNSKVKIQIQNGTGITGEAAYLQTQLKGLGYTNVSVGNATSQTATSTEVTFSSSLSSANISELTTKLNSLYQKVTTSNSATSAFDVVIVTGLRKGATPKASATPSATPTATP